MNVGDQIQLRDRSGAHLCTFTVAKMASDHLKGTFTPTDNYRQFKHLFDKYASLVEDQTFAQVDEVVEEIEAFGIYGTYAGEKIEIFDIQIYGDQGSLRLQPFYPIPPLEPNNGLQSSLPVKK